MAFYPWDLQTAIGKVNIVAECWVYIPKVRSGPHALGQVALFARGVAMGKYGEQ